MLISSSDISVIIQGSYENCEPTAEGQPSVRLGLASVRRHLPSARIILSTWKGEDIPKDLDIDMLVLNDDPGCKPRGQSINSKPNNVNRQIVSSCAGVRLAKTKYALKMRTDFLLTGTGFLDYFGKYKANNPEYKIFNDRVMVCMFGTRKPFAKHYNLPFHVSDFSTFGYTDDLLNLYDIPLVTDDEFYYFLHRPNIPRNTFAINRYNAEQSIIINFIKKNGHHVHCSYSTHIDASICRESELYLVNNFVPLAFSRFGIQPQKPALKADKNIEKYTDYFTFNEWLNLYQDHCNHSTATPDIDIERLKIDSALKLITDIDQQINQIYHRFGHQASELVNLLIQTKNEFITEISRSL